MANGGGGLIPKDWLKLQRYELKAAALFSFVTGPASPSPRHPYWRRRTSARLATAAPSGQVTTMPIWIPVMVEVTVSRARTAWVPTVLRVTLKVWTPALATVNR